MAMPFTGQELAEFRSLLRRQHDELRTKLRGKLLRADQERYADLASQVHDLADESVADLLSDVGLADIDQDVAAIRAVESALERVATGSYGSCVDCGADIGPERLRVMPAASRCQRCQAVHERTHTGGVHATF